MDEQTRTRTFELEPGIFLRADGERVDSIEGAASYNFRAAIFTGGEASDGDIIDMRSLRIDPEMPFFAQHMADATMQLGSLTGGAIQQGKRSLEAVWDGAIDLRGAGALQEVRQDVAHRMSTGELRRMSGRWARALDGSTVVTRRTKLDRTHSAFVDASKLGAEDPRGFGNHWQGPQAKEGSLVGLGADDDATGRSDAVRDFYDQCRAADANAEADAKQAERLLDPATLAADRSEHILTDLSDMMKKAIARIDELQKSMDDLRFDLVDEPDRAEGEETTDEPETVEGGTPLDAQGLRDVLVDTPADTESSTPRSIAQDAVNRLLGGKTPT